MNRNVALICAAIALWCRTSTAQEVISGTWSDDYATDTAGLTGWFKYSGSDDTTLIDYITTGDSGSYHRFAREKAANADRHHYMLRYFQCDSDANVSVSLSISGCFQGGTGSSNDHWRIYEISQDEDTKASSSDETEWLLSEITTTTTMTSDGTMSTFDSTEVSDQLLCTDWSDFYVLDIDHDFTVVKAAGTTGFVDANTDFEVFFKWKFKDASDQWVHVYDIEITCTEWSSPTSEPTTAAPSVSPSTANPTTSPSADPSVSPTTATPTTSPSKEPTSSPSSDPTVSPSNDPTLSPSSDPTKAPTSDPTVSPSNDPTTSPSNDPTTSPSEDPTVSPSADPTVAPSYMPTTSPTAVPTKEPTSPTTDPTAAPTPLTTDDPTKEPTDSPTADTSSPTMFPSDDPTATPTADTSAPTMYPSEDPTVSPSADPSATPSQSPTPSPTDPTAEPTSDPTMEPTTDPTQAVATPVPTPSPDSSDSGGLGGSGSTDGFDEVDWRSLALGAILASLFICCLFWVLIFIFWKKRNDSSTDETMATEMGTAGAETGV